jgi:hypothetical protein
VPRTTYSIPCTMYHIPRTSYLIPCTMYHIHMPGMPKRAQASNLWAIWSMRVFTKQSSFYFCVKLVQGVCSPHQLPFWQGGSDPASSRIRYIISTFAGDLPSPNRPSKCTLYPVLRISYLVPRTSHLVLRTKHLAPRTMHLAHHTSYPIHYLPVLFGFVTVLYTPPPHP